MKAGGLGETTVHQQATGRDRETSRQGKGRHQLRGKGKDARRLKNRKKAAAAKVFVIQKVITF
jgi:hypothetical protein